MQFLQRLRKEVNFLQISLSVEIEPAFISKHNGTKYKPVVPRAVRSTSSSNFCLYLVALIKWAEVLSAGALLKIELLVWATK